MRKSRKVLSLVLSILLIIENSPVLANLLVPAAISIPIKISCEVAPLNTKEITEGVYLGQVTPELTRTVDRSLITYTDRDEVASYNEVLTEIYAGGNTYVTEQQVDRTYDHLSQLKTEVVYERVSTELSGTVPPGGTVPNALISVSRRTKTDVVVDPLGVELHSIVREEDLTEAYLATDYNAALAQFGSVVASVNPTNPLAAYYDNYSFVSNGNFLGEMDGAYINEGGSVTLNLDEAVAGSKIVLGFYNGANQRGAAYRVEVSADGVNFETVAEQAITELVNPYSHEVTFAERSVKAIRFTVTHGINFGGGPLFYLSEIQLMTPKPSAVQQGIKSEIQNLDTLGLRAKYETSTRTTNKTNALGQIVVQTQIRNKTYEGMLIETVKVDRSNQVYNELGLLSSYNEETTTVMTTWLSFQRLDTNLTSPLPLSVNSYLYNYIGTAQDFDYNGHGHYVGLGSYAPTTWDIYQSSARTNITYNNKAQMTSYTESGISRPFGGNYNLTRTGMQYNAKGELVAFSESGNTEASGSYNFTRDNIVYASSVIASPEGARQSPSSVVSFHEAGVNPQDGPYNYIRENKAFDTRGRVTEVEESGTKNGFAYNYHRDNIKYNVNELATSWTEQGVMRGVTYDVTRHMTRYNNLGQETDHFEEGTRAGAHFFEIVQRQAYDKLGRFFKSETVSGETNYTVTYSGTRASTFYNQEGQVSGYTYYSGSTFVDVTNIQYDSNANIIGYTETTRGGATRVIFNILFDAAGRIISQQFTDSSMELKFGNVNTQTFSYDQKTGQLLEFKIENGDFIATFDARGNRKSFELSAQMKAFIEEEQKKAVEAAKARARKQAAAKKKVQDNRKLISRTEVIEKGGKGKPSLTTKLTDKALQALIKDDKVVKFLIKKLGEKKAAEIILNLKKGKSIATLISAEAIRQSVSGKLLTTIAQSIKARAPNAKSASEIIAANTIRRITEIYEVTDAKGNIHRVTEIKRIDGNGNQIERQVIDRFTFRDERGKKVKAQIVSLFNADDHLTKVGESYKQKMKKGTAVTKRTTLYNPETGDIISQKTKQKFEKSGFFNSTAGKILGAIIVVAAIIIAPYLMPFLSPLVAAGIGAGIAQFGVSLAQGNSFKDALISAGIAAGAAIIGAQIGSWLNSVLPNIPILGNVFSSLQQGLSSIGQGIGNAVNSVFSQAGSSAFTKMITDFVVRSALRVGTELVSENFGRKLGAFGTVFAIAVGSTLVSGLLSGALGSPMSASDFGSAFSRSFFSGALQGGIAEVLKNENGLGAQFLRAVGFETASKLDINLIGNNFRALQNRPEGSNPIYDQGYIVGFSKNVAGVGLLYDKTGNLSAVSPNGAKLFDFSEQTGAPVLGIINPDKPDQMVLYNDVRNSSVAVPSPAAMGSFLRESFNSASNYVSSAIDRAASNPYVKGLITGVKIASDDLNAQPARHDAIYQIQQAPYNLFHRAINPYDFKNPILDGVTRSLAETANFSLNIVNWVSNLGGYPLNYALAGVSKGYTAVDNLVIAKTGGSIEEWQNAALANGPGAEDVFLGGLVAIGRVSGATGAALRVGARVDDAIGSVAKTVLGATDDSIYVIGRRTDTAIANNWPGHKIFDVSDWSLPKNDQWIQGIIDRRAKVYIGSPQTRETLWDAANNRPTVFAREYEQLRAAGYKQVDDYLLPPN